MAEKNPGVKKGAPWGQYLMAYHCGSLPKGRKFDPSHILTGEGWKKPPLGPGLYFSDNLTLTRIYCQYTRKPTMTTARLNMRGVFWRDDINGAPGNKERKAYKILRENFASWGVSDRPPYKLSIIKNGSAYGGDCRGAIHSLHKNIPIKDAIRQGKAAQKQIRKYGPLYSKLYGEEGRTKRVADLEEKVHALGFFGFGMGHAKANRALVGLGIKGVGVRIRPEALEIAIFDPANIEVLDARRTSVRRSKRNPSKKVAKKKVTKKKVIRKKTPPYQLLINRCQKLWDHYCERPNKKRLKPVLEHLEKMKASTSKKVADERKHCLRVANKEARRLKMK